MRAVGEKDKKKYTKDENMLHKSEWRLGKMKEELFL